jgi:hypothetical protein
MRTVVGMNPGYTAYAIMRTAGAREDGTVVIDPTGFWDSVLTGAGLELKDPALTLRNYISRENKAGRLPADARLMELYLDATAWNHHVTREPWSKPSPRFETKGTTGKKVFPATQVPDFLSPDSRNRSLRSLRAAYGRVQNGG